MGILTGVAGLTAGASAAISSGVSAAAGIGSSIATNRKNQQLAQMNNEFNERMLDKQINYNREAYQTQLNDVWKFWDATNQYNSPESQVQRFRDAGLNPYLAIDNAGMASVQSTPSQQGINPPTATPVQADYSGIGQSIANAVSLYNQTKLSNEQAQQLKIENSFLAMEKMLQLKELIAKTDNIEFKTWAEKQMFTLEKQLKQSYLDGSKMDNLLKGQKYVLDSQAIIRNSEELKVLPQQLQLSLSEQIGQIILLADQHKLNGKQIKIAAASLAGILLDNQQKTMNMNEQHLTFGARKSQIEQTLVKTISETKPFEISSNPLAFIKNIVAEIGNYAVKTVGFYNAAKNVDQYSNQ